MKKICYFLQNVCETTWIVAADKEEEGRGNSLIQHEFNLVGAMKKIGVTVMKGMAGVGILILALCGCQVLRPLGLTTQISESETPDTGRWLAGDFHNHTYLTDGSNVPDQIFAHAFQFGLDWIANSEHGGAFSHNSEGQSWPTDTVFLGSPPIEKMWRWQSIWQYSYPLVAKARTTWPDKLIVQGYEWNVPGHDHASVAIVGPAEERGLALPATNICLTTRIAAPQPTTISAQAAR